MSETPNSYWKPIVAIVAAVAAALWVELSLVETTTANFVRLLLCNLLVALIATFIWGRQQTVDGQAIARYVTRLTMIEEGEIEFAQIVSPVPQDHPLHLPLEGIRDRMLDASLRVGNAEGARAAAEIRAVRGEDRLNRFREIIANLTTPIIAIDHFDEIVLANRSAESLFGICVEEHEEKSIEQILNCQELVDLMINTRRRKSASHRTQDLEFEGLDGECKYYKVTCRNVSLSERKDGHKGAVAVLSDVSGEKAIQKRNAEFVSAVSHEMKTPLSGIKAYVELLADGDAEDEETKEEFLEVINSQADRLQRLIDNMLNLSRIEAGVVKVSKNPHSLNAILEEALSVVEPSAEAKQIELLSELSAMYVGVLADRDLLLQAAINLLSNAIKYTPSGGQATLRSRLDGDKATFEVEDTGVGLSEEDCQRVFDKFYRVSKDQKMAAGTGLGLPLVKHIVEDVHAGNLTLVSEPGQGSTFSVTMLGVASMRQSTTTQSAT